MNSPDVMLSLLECPHCLQQRTYSLVDVVRTKTALFLYFYVCNGCGHGVCVETAQAPAHGTTLQQEAISYIYPTPPKPEIPAGTPEYAGGTLAFAKKIIHVSKVDPSWKPDEHRIELDAAGVMLRKGLETVMSELEASGDSLNKKLNDIRNRGLLPPTMCEWAHEVRIVGNEAAHGVNKVEIEDIEDATYFTEMLITYLYTLPRRVAYFRDRRNR